MSQSSNSEFNSLLSIRSIELTNFQCFKSCRLSLHPKMTVLVAENAQGKTALLKALRYALDEFVWSAASSRASPGISRNDIHLSFGEKDSNLPTGEKALVLSLPTAYVSKGYLNGEDVEWGLSVDKVEKRVRNVRLGSKKFTAQVRKFSRERNAETSPGVLDSTLPICAYYGTQRLHSERKQTKGKQYKALESRGRLSAYQDCLEPSSSLKTVSDWYGAMVEQVRNPAFRTKTEDIRPALALSAVRSAVSQVLSPTEWREIDWESSGTENQLGEFEYGYLVVGSSRKGRFPLWFLSDGVRNMVSLAADLSHRCARLNPHLGEEAASKTPGIVLIDEVDMHLHPRWQQLVLELLQKAFPTMQFVVSTHSPHVLSSVSSDCIRIIKLEEGEADIITPRFQTRGVESADVLAEIMGVDPVPAVEQAQWLNEYKAKIELGEGDSGEAIELRNKLISHFGDSHPVMLDCERLIRFQDFKRRKGKGGQNA